jgi:hypothetical protein
VKKFKKKIHLGACRVNLGWANRREKGGRKEFIPKIQAVTIVRVRGAHPEKL